MPEIEDKTKFS